MSRIDSGPLQASSDDSGRISDFFPGQKNVFLGGLQIIKIPIVQTDFIQKCTLTSLVQVSYLPININLYFHYDRRYTDIHIMNGDIYVIESG